MNNFNKAIASVRDLFVKHQPFILFSIIILSSPFIFSPVPYLNLVYTFDKGVLVYLIAIMVFIRPSAKFLLVLGVILLISVFLLLSFGFTALAEQLGNVIFLLLAIGIWIIIYSYFKNPSND